MFFPISDDDRELYKPALVTTGLLVLNIGVFVLQLLLGEDFIYGWSAIPAELTRNIDLVRPVPTGMMGPDGLPAVIPQAPGPHPIYLTLLTSMFMHGGWAHIVGNMLYLWIFGDNVEHRFGHVRFLVFYLLSGLVGSAAHIAFNADSVVPTLGASGAISGVLGAYMVLFPRNTVYAVVFFFYVVSIPAVLVIGLWALTQFVYGFGSIAVTEQTASVAYMAHIGGFVTGVLAGLWCRSQYRRGKGEPDSLFRRYYARDPKGREWW